MTILLVHLRPQILVVHSCTFKPEPAGSFWSIECYHFERERKSIHILPASVSGRGDWLQPENILRIIVVCTEANWFTSSDQFHTNTRRSILLPSTRTIKKVQNSTVSMMLPELFWHCFGLVLWAIPSWFALMKSSLECPSTVQNNPGVGAAGTSCWENSTNLTINTRFILFFVESSQLFCFGLSKILFQNRRNKNT